LRKSVGLTKRERLALDNLSWPSPAGGFQIYPHF
jgi:hypothetical protein